MSALCKKELFLALKIRIKQKVNMKGTKHLIYLLLVASFAFANLTANAQHKTLEIGLFGGTSYYIGDLNPAIPYNMAQLGYGAVARLNTSPRWAFKLSYSRGKVKGDDLKTKAVLNRELNFVTTINDFSLVAEFNFWKYFTGSKKTFFTPFLFGGVGFVMFTPKAADGTALQPLGTEGQNSGFDGRKPYLTYSLAIPFGIGFKYSINERLGLAFEWGMRKTFTDYIDDVSTTYYDNSVNDPYSDPTLSHDAYEQRGNSSTYDWYNFTGITLTYKIDLYNKNKCNVAKW
jgi:hypothetical protein